MSMTCVIRRLRLVCAGCLIFSAATASATPVVIDDFSGSLNPAYVQAYAFVGSNAAVITYDTTTNPGSLTYGYTGASSSSQAVQTDLLRDDYKLLTDGDWVQIKTTINVTSAGTSNPTRMFGGVAVGLKGDATRNNIAAVYVRSDGSASVQYNNSGIVADTLAVAGSLFATISGPGTSIPVWTRLTRASATSLIPAYSTDGINFTSGSAVPIVNLSGLGIGVYNGNATTSRTGTVLYDDLTVNIIPEPTAIFLVSIGSIGIVFFSGLRKRK
jgi:hypothetical protein